MGWGFHLTYVESTKALPFVPPRNPQDAAAAFQEAPAATILAQNIDDKMVQIDTWIILKR